MKTIITSTGNSTESKFDNRFGKANWYCLFNEDSGNIIFIKNGADGNPRE